MNLKRMAIVAAAAVVGPTVLMATPAMADETQGNTAVTTPDAAPAAEAPAADVAAPAAPAPIAPAPVVPAPVVPAPNLPAPPSVPAPAEKPVADENGDDEGVEHGTGPVLGLNGIPSTIKAGGDWTKFTVSVDNSKGKAEESYVLVLAVADENEKLSSDDVTVQVFFNGAWHDVEVISDGGTPVALLTEDLQIPKGKLALQVRVKFAADAPVGNIAIAAAGGSNVDENVWSDTVWAESKIVSGANHGGGNNGGGNTGGNTGGNNGGGNTGTKPNGGGTTTPIVDHNTDNGGSTTTGGELAETGTDAATTWALGAGGVALAMGVALVAGTGKRRRVQA
ncbi:hypothetical protein AB0P15_26580 [Streptomyces sp. NPDC087917]|uniref:hypothetical protein n=1 Tax=unclassified Streptomyces TaxID=2593676 RepID=UPI0034411FA4